MHIFSITMAFRKYKPYKHITKDHIQGISDLLSNQTQIKVKADFKDYKYKSMIIKNSAIIWLFTVHTTELDTWLISSWCIRYPQSWKLFLYSDLVYLKSILNFDKLLKYNCQCNTNLKAKISFHTLHFYCFPVQSHLSPIIGNIKIYNLQNAFFLMTSM